MKNTGRLIFIVICLVMCITPLAGMLVMPTDTTTENRELAVIPDIKTNGKLNVDFMKELGAYFEDHFAFRQALVTADAEIQSKLFQVSNADTVIDGSDGWLYYASTVDDYLGRNLASERRIANIAHNLSLVQQYVEDRGAVFLFTVAPNKNSLYGEHMPYYLKKKVSEVRNVSLLEREMEKQQIPYADLFKVFEESNEVLYLKRDSHWNQKGAVLAYNTLLDSLGIAHDNYVDVKFLRLKEEYGDLNKMLYPLSAEPEWNYYYQKEDTFTYATDTKSVEDAWIVTENGKGSGSLLMFRDSFGNTLLPLMANTFSKGYFSKAVPQNISEYMEDYKPDVVILEKVERNIQELAKEPPVTEGIAVTLKKEIEKKESNTSLKVLKSKSNNTFLEVRGILDDALCAKEVQIYISIVDEEGQNIYKAFYVSDEKSDYGYKLYIPKEKVTGNASCSVIVEKDGTLFEVKALDIPKKLTGKRKKEREIISKEKVYDCDGSGHGYYIIKWSDGKEEYEDF